MFSNRCRPYTLTLIFYFDCHFQKARKDIHLLILFSLMMQHSVFLRRSSFKKRNLLTSIILDCRIVCLHPLKYLMFVEEKCNDKKSSSFDWHMLTDILWYDDFGSAPQINLTQIFVFVKYIADMKAPSWYIYH